MFKDPVEVVPEVVVEDEAVELVVPVATGVSPPIAEELELEEVVVDVEVVVVVANLGSVLVPLVVEIEPMVVVELELELVLFGSVATGVIVHAS
jgi:hypothetical protein